MKRFSLIFLAGLLLMGAMPIFYSCSNTQTYAQQLDAEKTLIAAYIKRNGIQLVDTLPAVNKWTDKLYYHSTSGLYFHLVSPGDTDTLVLKDLVVPRYIQYTLDVVADTVRNWSTIDYPFPATFIYGDLSQSCKGFQEAVSYMKGNNSQAKLIVPSKLGFSTYLNSVTPLGYDLKIQIQK